jgi:hypothetical protein
LSAARKVATRKSLLEKLLGIEEAAIGKNRSFLIVSISFREVVCCPIKGKRDGVEGG